MDSEVHKIYSLYFARFDDLIKSLKELSCDKANMIYLVNNLNSAYDYDMIKDRLLNGKQGIKSVDALYFNNKVNFIEFKRGYKPKGNSNKRYLENLKLSGKDSLLLHINFVGNCSKVKNQFVAVINSGTDGSPSDALASVLAKHASTAYLQLESALQLKLKKFLTDVKNFDGINCYSSIRVWNDINFDNQLRYDS